MAGIEHDQADWLRAAFEGTASEPGAYIVAPGRPTANQAALSVAIGLAWCRLGKLRGPAADACHQRTLAFYETLARYGHQATTSGGYADEQGAPAPHDALWALFRWTCLREARLQGLTQVRELAVREAAEEVALCRAFWTPAGVRQPGSRAKGAKGQPLRPVWATCSWAYAMITGLPAAGLDKPDKGAVRILMDSRSDFPAILAASRTVALRLHIPVYRWDLPEGGFVAALSEDEPMSDRLSWVRVDATGEITGASDTLGDLPPDLGAPDAVIGVPGGASASPVPGPAPAPPKPPATAPSGAGDFSARLSALSLSRRDSETRGRLLAQLAADAGPAEIAAIADAVAGFGIGENQEQAAAWHALVDDLRRAAALH